MKDNENNNKIFKFRDKKYNFKVAFDEESKLLKLVMINIDTKKETVINVSGLIPQRSNTRLYIIK